MNTQTKTRPTAREILEFIAEHINGGAQCIHFGALFPDDETTFGQSVLACLKQPTENDPIVCNFCGHIQPEPWADYGQCENCKKHLYQE